MGWKDWSYVKKGIILAAIIYLLLVFLFFLSSYLFGCKIMDEYSNRCLVWGLLGGIIYLPSSLFFIGINGKINYSWVNHFSPVLAEVVFIFLGLVIYIVIGALIGWIVGKIKSRNEVKNNGI